MTAFRGSLRKSVLTKGEEVRGMQLSKDATQRREAGLPQAEPPVGWPTERGNRKNSSFPRYSIARRPLPAPMARAAIERRTRARPNHTLTNS